MSDLPPNSNPPPPKQPPPVPLNAEKPHKEPSDAEEVYYEGSPRLRGLGFKLLLWPIVGLLVIAIPFFTYFKWHHQIPLWMWALPICVGAAITMIPSLMAKTVRYRITNYRIDFERGIFSRDIDTLELWHVEDLHFHQSLLDRILGVGSILVESHDQTLPKLDLKGLPNPRPLYETLKQRVIAVKRSRGVIKVDPG